MEHLWICSLMAYKTPITAKEGLCVGSVKVGFFANERSPVVVGVDRDSGPIFASALAMKILDSGLRPIRTVFGCECDGDGVYPNLRFRSLASHAARCRVLAVIPHHSVQDNHFARGFNLQVRHFPAAAVQLKPW